MSLNRLVPTLLLVATATLSLVVLSLAPAGAAGLLVADGGFGGQLSIKEHDVHVTVNNGVAVTDVEQVFVNEEDRIVEALYMFPVPKGASVSNFSMWIGGKEMIGEVVEKERAREIYESYKQTRRDPGLLEQVDYKTFEMRVFPIAPRAEQRIKVTYYQELDFDHDWATYVYPLATVARAGIDQQTTGKCAFTLDVKSETPLVKLESPSHADDFVVVNHAENYVQASFEADGGTLSKDFVLAFKTSRPRSGIDLIASKTNSEDGYFQLTLTAGEELAAVDSGADYVFVLDVSGSMANDGKLRLSRDSIFAFVNSLGERDRFEVMTFNVAAQSQFGKLEPVTAELSRQAEAFLASQRARGGTNLRPAISAAYNYRDPDRTLNVVILSDGMTEQREQAELLQLIRQRPGGSRVFCVGVGNEVNRPLLEQVAQNAGGVAAFISDSDNFDRQAEAFRRKLVRPAMRDPKLSFRGADIYDVEPAELPDLFHGSPIRVYGRYRQSGPLEVTLRAEIEGAVLDETVEIVLPAADDANPEIERMWAWHRVDRLMADQRTLNAADKHKQQIVELCEGYSIASEYASFIVLENDAEYQRWKIDRRNATRIVRDRAAQQRVRDELRQLRERAMAQTTPSGQRGNEVVPETPQLVNRPAPAPVIDTRQASQSPQSPTSRDFAMPTPRRRGGGGAIDPITGLIALGIGGAAAARRRKTSK